MSTATPAPLEPVLRWDDLITRSDWPTLDLHLDDALIDAYLRCSGESDPAFAASGLAGAHAPMLATTFVRFAKAALGGRWPTGTLQLTQAVQSFRALRRGETIRLGLKVDSRVTEQGRHILELITTMRDVQGLRVGTQSASLIWWREAEFERVAKVHRGARPAASATANRPDQPPDPSSDGPLLGPLSDQFNLQRLQAYGAIAGARDPIHVDPDFAASTPSGANIAQGKLVVATVARLMHGHLGQAWLERGGFALRLRRPVKVGETVRAWARPLAPGRWQVWCDKPDGERAIEGEAFLIDSDEAQSAQHDA